MCKYSQHSLIWHAIWLLQAWLFTLHLSVFFVVLNNKYHKLQHRYVSRWEHSVQNEWIRKGNSDKSLNFTNRQISFRIWINIFHPQTNSDTMWNVRIDSTLIWICISVIVYARRNKAHCCNRNKWRIEIISSHFFDLCLLFITWQCWHHHTDRIKIFRKSRECLSWLLIFISTWETLNVCARTFEYGGQFGQINTPAEQRKRMHNRMKWPKQTENKLLN